MDDFVLVEFCQDKSLHVCPIKNVLTSDVDEKVEVNKKYHIIFGNTTHKAIVTFVGSEKVCELTMSRLTSYQPIPRISKKYSKKEQKKTNLAEASKTKAEMISKSVKNKSACERVSIESARVCDNRYCERKLKDAQNLICKQKNELEEKEKAIATIIVERDSLRTLWGILDICITYKHFFKNLIFSN